MTTATVSAKGWVVIPAEHRKKYGIRGGEKVAVVDYGGGLSLVPLSGDPVKDAQGMLGGRTSLTKALLRERTKERQRERRR